MGLKEIEDFLSQARRRFSLRVSLTALSWTLLAAVVAMLAYAIIHRAQGLQVPWFGYLAILFWALVVAVLWTLSQIPSRSQTARRCDEHFKLKDGLASHLQFRKEQRQGEVYELQQASVAQQLEGISSQGIKLNIPTRLTGAVIVGLIASIWLATLPNSQAVQKRLDAETDMLSRTEEVKSEIEKAVEELLEGLDEDEKKALSEQELKELVDTLKETKDQKEALRKLARFEQKVASAMQGLEARKDEAVLKLAAAELSKSDLSSSRQLGLKLGAQEFKKAAEDMKKLREMRDQAREMTPEERKKMLENLREATKRMAQAGKKQGNNQVKANGKVGKAGEEMADLFDELDEEAAQMLQDFKETGECEECENGAFCRLDERLKKLDARKRLRSKLGKMRKKLSQCQSYCAGQCQSLNSKPGQGKGIGSATDESRREGTTDLPNEMNSERLTGQKRQGRSQTMVEDAESGSGISGRRTATQERSFARQVESFVTRDDIPENMKVGVREYFERIHEMTTDDNNEVESN